MKWYGYLGLVLIIFIQLNMLFKIEPFASWYIPIVWYGYILFIDALVFKLKGKSLISSGLNKFLLVIMISIPIWSVYEFYNFIVQNWVYINYSLIVHLVDFTIILPALLESRDLFMAKDWFKKTKIKRFKASKKQLSLFIFGGVFFLIIPWILPVFFFWGMWLAMFLLFDPVNYLLGNDSFIKDFTKGRLNSFISTGLGGLLCGFFWEFWNNWAVPKWFYNIPLVDFWHVFEMPLLGYFGYIPFAWSMFSMYVFAKNLIKLKKA